jgi:hypothetical protein
MKFKENDWVVVINLKYPPPQHYKTGRVSKIINDIIWIKFDVPDLAAGGIGNNYSEKDLAFYRPPGTKMEDTRDYLEYVAQCASLL